MSDFYIIGENRKIASIGSAEVIVSTQVGGTTYVYWRHSALLTGVGTDASAEIRMSSSTDLKTWTAPVVVYYVPGMDVSPAGVVNPSGSTQVMVVAEINTVNGAVTTRKLSSTTGTSWTSTGTITFSEYWAFPTDLSWTGTHYYLAATVRNTFDGPLQSLVRHSTDLSAWTSLGRVDQLSAKDNVWARIAVTGTEVHLVHREGGFATQDVDDRILYSRHDGVKWTYIQIAVTGTGNPDIALLVGGYAVIYKDQSIVGGHGSWAWMFYDNAADTFAKRGVFSQDFQYGTGGWALSTPDGFLAMYATRTNDLSSSGTLYNRAFTSTTDEAPAVYAPYFAEKGEDYEDVLENFSVEVSYGQLWVNLTDSTRFYVAPDDFGAKAQVHRRITAQSPYFEGTYLVHAVRENVTEQITVGVLGTSQNHVTENLLLLEDMFSQPSYQIRLIMGDHVETWSCQIADYTIERGHIMMHNTRAMMKLSVPRLPEVSYEVT